MRKNNILIINFCILSLNNWKNDLWSRFGIVRQEETVIKKYCTMKNFLQINFSNRIN